MAFEWKDKKDGVDDILADDINDMAHAIIDGMDAIVKLGTPVNVEAKPTSLIGITTYDSGYVNITENQIEVGVSGTAFINVQGEVDIDFNTSGIMDVFVDDEKIYYFDINTMAYIGNPYYVGKVNKGITIVFDDTGSITFTKFIAPHYTGGILSPELARKVIETEFFTEEEKKKLGDTQIYTEEEKNELARVSAIEGATSTLRDVYFDELLENGVLSVDEGAVVTATSVVGGTEAVFSFGCNVHISSLGVKNESVITMNGEQQIFKGYFSYDGYIDSLVIQSSNGLDFTRGRATSGLQISEYKSGYMNESHLKRLENTCTIAEVNSLIGEAFGTVEAVFDEVHEYAESLGGDEA